MRRPSCAYLPCRLWPSDVLLQSHYQFISNHGESQDSFRCTTGTVVLPRLQLYMYHISSTLLVFLHNPVLRISSHYSGQLRCPLHGCHPPVPKVTDTVHNQRAIVCSCPEPELHIRSNHSAYRRFPMDLVQFRYSGMLL